VTPSASVRSISTRTSAGSTALNSECRDTERRLDVLSRVQREVEPVGVADDDGTVWILLGGSRVKTEVSE
jgi:hypothetical protein